MLTERRAKWTPDRGIPGQRPAVEPSRRPFCPGGHAPSLREPRRRFPSEAASEMLERVEPKTAVWVLADEAATTAAGVASAVTPRGGYCASKAA